MSSKNCTSNFQHRANSIESTDLFHRLKQNDRRRLVNDNVGVKTNPATANRLSFLNLKLALSSATKYVDRTNRIM